MTLEKEIEAALVRMVSNNGGRCLKFVSPGQSGVPDRLILLPGGHAIFAEVKKPKGGRVGPLQLVWQERLMKLGFWSGIVCTREDIAALELIVKDMVARHG